MSKRNFPDFLNAYIDYAEDDFCPDVFHKWVGISIISGAMERKTWIPWTTFEYFPNLFIFLIASPGLGKTTACNSGVALLRKVKGLNFTSPQISVARLYESLAEDAKTFQIGSTIYPHSSQFYYAPEASDCLKDVSEDIIAALTNFYDCPGFSERGTKKDKKTTVDHACLNLLAACTFNYLNEILEGNSIMGGFASRIIYIIGDDNRVRTPKWGVGKQDDIKTYNLLAEDLSQINKLKGPFKTDDEVGKIWAEWFEKTDEKRMNEESEKLKALLVRQNTNLVKLCMIMSASRSDELVIRMEDWERANQYIATSDKNITGMLRMVSAHSQKKDSSSLLNAMVFITGEGPYKEGELIRRLLSMGFDKYKIDAAFKAYISNDEESLYNFYHQGKHTMLKLIGNPDKYI